MKLGAFFLLGGTLALAGCASPLATGPSSTPTPRAPTAAAIRPTADPPVAPTLPPPKRVKQVAPASRAPYDRGRAYMTSHDYRAAEQAFRTSIAQRQHLTSSYDGLGTAAVALRDYATAYRAYKSALGLEPKSPLFIYRAAYTALYARDYHAAVAYATRYITMRPKDAAAYHLRLLAYGGLLNAKKQEEDARTIVRLQPHDANAYNDLGIAMGQRNKYKQAIGAFSQAIRMQPQNGSYYINRAIVENLNKQPTLALADLERARALARDPTTKKQLTTAIGNLEKRMQH